MQICSELVCHWEYQFETVDSLSEKEDYLPSRMNSTRVSLILRLLERKDYFQVSVHVLRNTVLNTDQ